ncbi:hypothetical protein D9758_005213 [Tetrapyrgos nigripes]|uniref:Uncharacterized protein n=1 Tax=Tetrapyrgos nigripes TaxID=182062 RepID=A0A8H5GX23_9AGAR|nr:hypothetical protein D9758_005213 [Tetrapyrgos nigripes]
MVDVDKKSTLWKPVRVLEAIGDIFPSLEKLEFITKPTKYYDDMAKYTPRILFHLPKLRTLRRPTLSLDLEQDANDKLDTDHDRDLFRYNRCLHRRHAAAKEIANVDVIGNISLKTMRGMRCGIFFVIEKDDNNNDTEGTGVQGQCSREGRARMVKTKPKGRVVDEDRRGVWAELPGGIGPDGMIGDTRMETFRPGRSEVYSDPGSD